MGYFLITDETFAGTRLASTRLEVASPTTTLRQIIMVRIQQEIASRNTARWEKFAELMRIHPGEIVSNGPREIDPGPAVAAALAAFNANHYFVLTPDGQVEDLDAPLEVSDAGRELTFLKITQLVGG